MAQNENKLSVGLPESLRQQFCQVERRLWLVETTLALCSGLGGLLFSYLAFFFLDRLLETPVSARLFFFCLGLSFCVVAGVFWTRNWVWKRRNLRTLAKLVQKKYRRLGDRLLGIVELSNEQRHLSNFSPALYHAAIEQVATEAHNFDFKASVSPRLAKQFVAICCGLLALVASIALVFPQASWNSFCRWSGPTAKIQRYTLVGLEGLTEQLTVAHGEPFSVSGTIQYRTFWKPRHAKGQIGKQAALHSVISENNLRLAVPAQMQEDVLLVRVGDAFHKIKILPRYRPSLKELSASIHLPEYLEYPTQTEIVRNGTLLALQGSQISIHAKVSRTLSAAQVQSESLTNLPLTLTNGEFSSDLGAVSGLMQFNVTWKDDINLTNPAPLHLSIQSQEDLAPSVDLPDLPRNVSMLASDVLPIRVQSRDDFGVSDQGLMWEVLSDNPGANSSIAEVKVMTSTHQEKLAEKLFQWSPSVYRIPADSVVELQAYARDYLPGRERCKTPIYQIQILSPEKHAELIRQRLEALLSGLEEVTRLQEKVVNNTTELTQQAQKPDTQQANRLSQAKEDQQQNAEKLEQMAESGQRTLQEAMKNPLISEDSVRDFARTMQQWQKLSREQMQDASKSLKSAQQNSKSRQEDLAQALKKEQEALKALEKQQNKNEKDMDQLRAMTLAQRLRKIATQETEVSEQLLGSAPDVVGLLPAEVPQKYKDLGTSLTKGQETVQKDSDTLVGEISRFFERTQKTNYSQVSKEMKDAHISEELDKLNGMIRENVIMDTSSQLTNWAQQFQAWGDLLEPKSDKSSSQSSSGKGDSQKKKDLGKQLVELLRLREQEITLRQQTSLLDEQKGTPENYSAQTAALLKDHQKASQTLDKIHKDTDLPELDKPFEETATTMREVEKLLQKPQTGKETDQAEDKSVALLSDLINLINEQAQKPPPQQQPSQGDQESSAEEMAFLTQMMKEAKTGESKPMQSPGGGNTAGGSTQRNGSPITGNTRGKGAASRSVNKAAGMINSAPAEFRDALENYYREVEKTTKAQ